MCHRMVTLAKLDNHRSLSWCEHKLIHLRWRRAAFALTEGDFRRLEMLLDWTIQTDAQSPYAGRFVRQAEDGYMEIIFEDVILRLLWEDFQQLAAMLSEGRVKLEEGSPAKHIAKTIPSTHLINPLPKNWN